MIQGRKTKTAELAEKLKDRLLAERLPKNSPVMSVRKLAEHFGISTSTAAQILKRLEEEGILYQKPQSGTFVRLGPETAPRHRLCGTAARSGESGSDPP